MKLINIVTAEEKLHTIDGQHERYHYHRNLAGTTVTLHGQSAVMRRKFAWAGVRFGATMTATMQTLSTLN